MYSPKNELPEFFEKLDENIRKLAEGTPSKTFTHILDFQKIIRDETDRGTALMSAAYIDEQLKGLLLSYFIDDINVTKGLLSSSGPIGSFSARIELSYSLGLIANNIKKDLNLLRKIRNDFAHLSTPMTFETDSVKSRCLELKTILVPKEFCAKRRFTRAMTTVVIQIELTRQGLNHKEVKKDYDDTHTREQLNLIVDFTQQNFNADLSSKI